MKHLSKILILPSPLAHWANIKIAFTSFLWPAAPSDTAKFYNLLWCALDPGGIVSSLLIWPFKKWLVLNFFQNLMYWLSENRVNHLSSGRPRLPSKVSLGSVIVVSVRPKIPHILRDNLSLPFPLLLILFDLFILVNLVHELTYTANKFPGQRFPQTMLSR